MIYRFLILGLVANVCLASSRDKLALKKDKEIKEEKRIPYNFEYNSRDENGTTQFRKESSDANGKVEGRYGYKDMYGIERIVEYTADENGYRAEIKTNEPGTESKNPAGVLFYAQPMDASNLHAETAANAEHLRTDQNRQEIPSGDNGQSSPVLLSQSQPSSGQQYFFIGEQPQMATASASATSSNEEGIQKYSFFGANDDKKTESAVFQSASPVTEEKQSLDVPKDQPAIQFDAPQQLHYVGGNNHNQFLVSPFNQYYQYAPQNNYAPLQRSHISAQPLTYSSVPQNIQPLVYQYAPQPLAYQNHIASPAHAGPAYASYGLVNYSLQGQQFSSPAKTQ